MTASRHDAISTAQLAGLVRSLETTRFDRNPYPLARKILKMSR